MRDMLIALATLCGSGCATIGAGQAGVVWHATGGTDPVPIGEGWHYVSPTDQLATYDLRTLQRNEKLDVLSSNGLSISLHTTIRFHVVPEDVALLHRQVGPDYYDVILGPVLRSQARRVVGRYSPEEIYSTKRELIEREMREAVEHATAGKHVALEAILVRNVELPEMLQRAIVDKLAEEQRSLKMRYVLEHEQQEAQRKKIEAKGISDFQDLISVKLTEPYLRWKQIAALEQLAQSTNAKVVLLGGAHQPLLIDGAR